METKPKAKQRPKSSPKKTATYELRIVKVGRVCEASEVCIKHPEGVLPLLDTIRNHVQEHFVCFTLDGAGHILNTRVITIGLLNHSLVHPREVFVGAITDHAASVIVAHNHPSGSLDVSSQDIAITTQLKEAGGIIGIQLLDHVIVTSTGHLSMREMGMV